MHATHNSLLSEASRLASIGQTAEARAKLKEAFALQSISVDGLIILAQIFIVSNRIRAAQTVLERAIASQPTHVHALRLLVKFNLSRDNRGRAIDAILKLVDDGGRIEEIGDVLNAVVIWGGASRSEINLSLNYKIGLVYLLGCRFEQAKGWFLKAPEKSEAQIQLHTLACILGQRAIDIHQCNWNRLSKYAHKGLVRRLILDGRTDEVVSFLNETAQRRFNMPQIVGSNTSKTANGTVFLASLPKSGSAFVINMFESLSGWELATICFGVGAEHYVIPSWIDVVGMTGVVAAGHCAANKHNIEQFERHDVPLFVQIRDPRDATWSWFRFLEERPPLELMELPYLPLDYHTRSYLDRMKLMFEGHLPFVMHWIKSWRTYIEAKRLPVLLSRYEDFQADNAGTIKRLLAFTNVSTSEAEINAEVAKARKEAKSSGAYHFREGRVGSWRELKSPEVMAIIDMHWDEDLMRYFGYCK